LDDPNITSGTRVYLPVFVKGGLLSFGDVHGTQGDTEWRAPLEVDSTITFTVRK
jgi:amidase